MTAVLTAVKDGVLLRVRVQPRASQSEIAGLHGDVLRIRLAAPPVDGAANEALIRLLAEFLDIPRAAVTLRAGHTSRSKTVLIRTLDCEAVRRKLGLEPDPAAGRRASGAVG